MASKTGGGHAPSKVLRGCVVGVECGEVRGRRPKRRLRLCHGLMWAVFLVKCLGCHVLLGGPILLGRKSRVVACACRLRTTAEVTPGPPIEAQCPSAQ